MLNPSIAHPPDNHGRTVGDAHLIGVPLCREDYWDGDVCWLFAVEWVGG